MKEFMQSRLRASLIEPTLTYKPAKQTLICQEPFILQTPTTSGQLECKLL